ncbi:hypothetical protein EUTSA_v10001237mg [Eutrema salsugineum]|uniref:Pentacotripeptide-repeat region of PRORP domain-containing protein n=1 Tax=Eutrema salsugineum TaxID=72664 RepID=V4LIP7_EUTSA|nr:hypothetical protein EUTSA_v10001237mg [Eutrema salsugineum]
MIKTQILQQQTRRLLSNRSCFFRSFETLSDPNGTPLSRWKQEQHHVKPSDLRSSIKNLCDSKKFSKALEASKWMGEQNVFEIFPEDYTARFHLVENLLGLEEAEKDYSVYATLLSSYTRSKKEVDKAESTFEKMRELGFLLKPFLYNSMISLYGQLQNQDMVGKLVHEMLENNVEMDGPTVNSVLSMEGFKTWVAEQEIKIERGTIVAMERAFTASGSIEKAIEITR